MSHLPSLAMGESERRRQSRYLNKSVCRTLFGTVDHEELRRDLKNQLKEIKNSHCQRWNFDFENHSPLTGNYIWEAFDIQELPVFYRDSSPPVPTADTSSDPGIPSLKLGLESSGNAKENGKNNRKSGAKAPRNRKRETPAPITDFFAKRKTAASKLRVETPRVIPGEKTRRKRIR